MRLVPRAAHAHLLVSTRPTPSEDAPQRSQDLDHRYWQNGVVVALDDPVVHAPMVPQARSVTAHVRRWPISLMEG
jgi:hypothetical protein